MKLKREGKYLEGGGNCITQNFREREREILWNKAGVAIIHNMNA
jgi:hypothetical protein